MLRALQMRLPPTAVLAAPRDLDAGVLCSMRLGDRTVLVVDAVDTITSCAIRRELEGMWFTWHDLVAYRRWLHVVVVDATADLKARTMSVDAALDRLLVGGRDDDAYALTIDFFARPGTALPRPRGLDLPFVVHVH